MRKITVKEASAFAPPRGKRPPTRITVTLNNGGSITRQVDNMPGFTGQPMQRADVERKFRSNVAKRWPAAHAPTPFCSYCGRSSRPIMYARCWVSSLRRRQAMQAPTCSPFSTQSRLLPAPLHPEHPNRHDSPERRQTADGPAGGVSPVVVARGAHDFKPVHRSSPVIRHRRLLTFSG